MFESIFGDDIAIEELAVDVRRELVHVVAADADEDLEYALITQRQAGKGALLGRDDFGWILRQLDGGPEASLAAMGAAAKYLFEESNFEQVDQVLQLNPGGYGYSLFADRLGAWELQYPRAISAREAWIEAKARRTAHEKKFSQARGAWVDGQIHEALDAYGAGDLSAYWQASRLLTVRPGTDRYSDELQPDLTLHPRWQALSEPSKEKFFQQSLDFLVRGHCDRDSWFGRLHRHFPSEAAYRALTLLLRLAPDEIQTLPDRVWSE